MTPDGGARGGTVGDWMSKPPVAVAEDTPIRAAIAQMERADVRHLLVMDGPVLTGILSTRDLRRLVGHGSGSPELAAPVRSIMSEGPVSVGCAVPLTVAARLLLERRIGALPVWDGERVVGVFTAADALEALLAIAEGPRA
jgi:CBS domain-containing protein